LREDRIVQEAEHPDALGRGARVRWQERVRRPTLLQGTMAAVGLALLAILVHQAGPARIVELVTRVGWWTPLVLVPYALGTVIDAEGWRVTFARMPPSRWLLFRVRLAGEAVNTITPTAYLGGEPVKAYLLGKSGVPVGEAATSVILAKTALTISQIAFVNVGAALFFFGHGAGWSRLPTLLLMIASAVAVTAILVRWQRRRPVSVIVRLGRRLLPKARFLDRLGRRADEIDDRLGAFYQARPRAAVASVGLQLVGWFAGAVEIVLIMRLIGVPITWGDAVVIEALAQPMRFLGLIIPGTIGVFEAGGLAVCALVGVPQDAGLAMLLLKRLREIAYSVIGVALLASLRGRDRRV
jgi:putative membrane protein